MMERYTSIPSVAEALLVLAQQMIDGAASYESEFQSALLTAKRATLSTASGDVDTKQADADTKNASYVSARNIYQAARDLLTSAKEAMNDASDSLRTHILNAVAAATSGMSAEDLAQFEADTGIALTEPLLFLAPVAPVFANTKFVDGSMAWLNWNPVVSDEAGHGAASAYLVEKSADGSTWAHEQIVVNTEVYVDTTGQTHYRVTPFGDAGQGASVTEEVANFDPAA